MEVAGDHSAMLPLLVEKGPGAAGADDHQRALQSLERGQKRAREVGDHSMELRFEMELATLLETTGDQDGQSSRLERALILARELGARSAEATLLCDTGNLVSKQGDPDGAIRWYQQALSLHTELGELHGITLALGNIGRAQILMGDHAGGEAWLRQALDTAVECGNYPQAMELYFIIARARNFFLASDRAVPDAEQVMDLMGRRPAIDAPQPPLPVPVLPDNATPYSLVGPGRITVWAAGCEQQSCTTAELMPVGEKVHFQCSMRGWESQGPAHIAQLDLATVESFLRDVDLLRSGAEPHPTSAITDSRSPV